MRIQVNGQEAEVEPGLTLAELLARYGLGEGRIAVEINAEIVPRSQHDRQLIQPGDRIEVVQAIGGG
jgi:sulfur carrier protein